MALSEQYEKQAKATKSFWKDNAERSAIGKEAQDKLGTYDEAAGGGTPIKKGEDFKLVDNPQEADAIREQEKNLPDSAKTNIRVKQPRNPDGTFGYNSQNRRGLRYKSRGKTIPDFLKEYVAIWYREGKTGEDLITSQDEDYMLAFDMTMDELIERSKYYLEKEDMFSFLAGKGDVVYTKKAGGEAKDDKEIKRDLEVAKAKRDPIMAQRQKENPDNLSFQEGKGANSKKIGNKFAKKSAPSTTAAPATVPTAPSTPAPSTTPAPASAPAPAAPAPSTTPTPTASTAPASTGGFADKNGKTYTKEQMDSAVIKFNEAFRDQLGVDLSVEDLQEAREAGLIDDEIWDSLF